MSVAPRDPDYRRLRYVRYADDCAYEGRKGCNSVTWKAMLREDEGRPLGIGLQDRVPITWLHGSKPVVSVQEKGRP